jgi:hypothetical protein
MQQHRQQKPSLHAVTSHHKTIQVILLDWQKRLLFWLKGISDYTDHIVA